MITRPASSALFSTEHKKFQKFLFRLIRSQPSQIGWGEGKSSIDSQNNIGPNPASQFPAANRHFGREQTRVRWRERAFMFSLCHRIRIMAHLGGTTIVFCDAHELCWVTYLPKERTILRKTFPDCKAYLALVVTGVRGTRGRALSFQIVFSGTYQHITKFLGFILLHHLWIN